LDSFEDDTRTTIGVDFKHKTLRIDGELVNTQIWDTAGQERFSCISKEYYRGANGCLLVYDVTDHQSFSRVEHWYNELITYCQTTVPPITILVGNKCDLKHLAQVSTDEATKFAKEHEMGFYETSAKSNSNVDEAFGSLVEDIVKEMKKNQISGEQSVSVPASKPISVRPREEEEEISTSCSCEKKR